MSDRPSGFDHLEFIEPPELKSMLTAKPASTTSGVQVVDVRGEDFKGGKIPGALNLPSEEWKDDDKVDALVSQIKDKQTVVVHCTMSRQRGPTAASRLLERLQVVQGEGGPKVVVLKGGYTAWNEAYGSEEGMVTPIDEPPSS